MGIVIHKPNGRPLSAEILLEACKNKPDGGMVVRPPVIDRSRPTIPPANESRCGKCGGMGLARSGLCFSCAVSQVPLEDWWALRAMFGGGGVG